MSAHSYFADDYQAARAGFLSAGAAVGAVVESFQNPHTGPDGAALFTDVLTLGDPHADAALAIESGTHGVEGFAGSGIQTGLLRTGLGSRLPPGVRLVMIHAINPYGFAHLRRVNEDNIDLNRNFLDHSKPYPPNDEYDQLSRSIAPGSLSMSARLAAFCTIAGFRVLHGRNALQSAVSRGQYTHERGLFFGGHFPAWSNRTLQSIVQGYLHGLARLAFIDIHTGLGPRGQGEIIINEPGTSPAAARAIAWWGKRVKSNKEGQSVSVDLEGSLKHAIVRMLPATQVTGVSLEYGTCPPMEVFRAMRDENWLHQYGGESHPRARQIKTRFRQAFYPDADDWKETVWAQAREVVLQALKGLTA